MEGYDRDKIGVIDGPGSMVSAIRSAGILTFCAVAKVPGISIEERTAPGMWFSDETLGPWDWKIECVREGDIVYGKLLGDKSTFMTLEYYSHLRNYRRSLPRYRIGDGSPEGDILNSIRELGSAQSGTLRTMHSLAKSKLDALMARLQMSCRIVIGDITRVHRGPDLIYSGWQRVSYCTPEDLYEVDEEGLPPFLRGREGPAFSLDPGCSPLESREILHSRIRDLSPEATAKAISRLLD